MTKELGTGYDVESQREARIALLENLQRIAITLFPAKETSEGLTTFCNSGLIHVAHGLGINDFDGLMANQIIDKALDLCRQPDSKWREDTWERGTVTAMKGGFAFLGHKHEGHGHVATIAPRLMQMSPSWGVMVPCLANVGKPINDFKLASACFLQADIPEIKCFVRTLEDE